MLYSVGHGTIDTDHDPGWGQEEEWSQDCSMVQVWISGRSVWPWYWWLTLTSHVTITTVWSLNNRKYSMLMFISNGWGSIISSSEHLESKNQFLVVLSSFVKNYNQHKRGVTQLGAVISSVAWSKLCRKQFHWIRIFSLLSITLCRTLPPLYTLYTSSLISTIRFSSFVQYFISTHL